MFKLIGLCLLSAVAGYALHWLTSSIADWRSDPTASPTQIRASALVLALALLGLGKLSLPGIAFYITSASLVAFAGGVWIVTARRAKRRRPAPGWLHH